MLHLNPLVTQVTEEGAFAVSDRANALAAAGHDVINLGIGQPDFSPPAHVLAAAEKAAIDGPHGYTSPIGLPALREAVAADASSRYGCAVSAEQIIIVPGGKVTIFFATMLFGGSGAEILYPDPGFPPYREAIITAGAKPVPYPITEDTDFGLKADEILSRLTPRTSLVIINSPANPTGGIIEDTELEKLARGLTGHPGVAVLSDEIYGALCYGADRPQSLLQNPELTDRVIVLDGWSKTFAMTGWRLGFGVWPQALVAHVRKLITVDHSCVNGVAQMAALTATTGPMDEVRAHRETFRKRRDFIVAGLNAIEGITCRKPGGAFYVFPNVAGTGLNGEQFAQQLLNKEYVATIAGTSFGDNGADHIRLSYAASMGELERALERIERFVHS